jgi:hypothetical protein
MMLKGLTGGSGLSLFLRSLRSESIFSLYSGLLVYFLTSALRSWTPCKDSMAGSERQGIAVRSIASSIQDWRSLNPPLARVFGPHTCRADSRGEIHDKPQALSLGYNTMMGGMDAEALADRPDMDPWSGLNVTSRQQVTPPPPLLALPCTIWHW